MRSLPTHRPYGDIHQQQFVIPFPDFYPNVPTIDSLDIRRRVEEGVPITLPISDSLQTMVLY
jgi:hypothetical protein